MPRIEPLAVQLEQDSLLGQLIAEIARFGGADKTKASQLARILLPHINSHTAQVTKDLQNEWNAAITAERAEAAQAVREAIDPPLDLNAYENQLQSQASDIDAFNLFIKKWCPHSSHLLDSDDNDGQYMRDRINQLTQEKSKDA
ncbi:hypothetical protein E3O44_12540 [Cryobacterium algoricola]|uniref:Uncharacterized protein n=1 Tax=Cryobacterium algoricola TaxID=1259183 RepID=A0ABY2IAG0_9MICO|nr:hypothetical protein [Cryobacterium algoricola]TFB85823.1 hypothetical protein E3O44_12540 [Cryobacterium algoricola]